MAARKRLGWHGVCFVSQLLVHFRSQSSLITSSLGGPKAPGRASEEVFPCIIVISGGGRIKYGCPSVELGVERHCLRGDIRRGGNGRRTGGQGDVTSQGIP